jgi:hypothetical protein
MVVVDSADRWHVVNSRPVNLSCSEKSLFGFCNGGEIHRRVIRIRLIPSGSTVRPGASEPQDATGV